MRHFSDTNFLETHAGFGVRMFRGRQLRKRSFAFQICVPVGEFLRVREPKVL
jgi:hypothetical protein